MNHKNNRRSVSTKNRIRSSLLTILNELPINRITVRALCDHAKINRSTFYNHYASPDEILNEIKNDFLSSITEILTHSDKIYEAESKQKTIEVLMLSILEFIEENKELCLILKNSDASPTIGNLIIENPVIHEHFLRGLSGIYPDEDMKYLFQYIQFGGFRVLNLWLLNGCDKTPKEMAQMLAAFISRF